MFFHKVKRKVQCIICPHQCILQEGQAGVCGVRQNVGGKITNRAHGLISALNFDPIEKKPLYHFYPGFEILSMGSYGCNLKCNFCQNWKITIDVHADNIKQQSGKMYPMDEIVALARSRKNNIGIAFTYNEPIVGFEYVLEVAAKIKKAGLKTVMVSNGYINTEPLEILLGKIDAFNIDIKAFAENFYHEITGGSLEPVLKTIKTIHNYKRHLELTYLVIPNKNDTVENFKEMVQWIYHELDENVVLHLSRYFPRYKQTQPTTPEHKLEEFYHIAKEKLKYVYIGNIQGVDQSNTYCPDCGMQLIERNGYRVKFSESFHSGICKNCGFKIMDEVP